MLLLIAGGEARDPTTIALVSTLKRSIEADPVAAVEESKEEEVRAARGAALTTVSYEAPIRLWSACAAGAAA